MAWLLKITSGKLQPGAGTSEVAFSLQGTLDNAAVGPLPGWIVILGVAGFYGWLGFQIWRRFELDNELTHGEVHV